MAVMTQTEKCKPETKESLKKSPEEPPTEEPQLRSPHTLSALGTLWDGHREHHAGG